MRAQARHEVRKAIATVGDRALDRRRATVEALCDDLGLAWAILGGFAYLDNVVDHQHRPALQAEVRRLLTPAVQRLGWEPKPGESELESQLRGSLIGALGTQGEDPEVQARARVRAMVG